MYWVFLKVISRAIEQLLEFLEYVFVFRDWTLVSLAVYRISSIGYAVTVLKNLL